MKCLLFFICNSQHNHKNIFSCLNFLICHYSVFTRKNENLKRKLAFPRSFQLGSLKSTDSHPLSISQRLWGRDLHSWNSSELNWPFWGRKFLISLTIPCMGSPRDDLIPAVQQLLEDNPFMSEHALADKFSNDRHNLQNPECTLICVHKLALGSTWTNSRDSDCPFSWLCKHSR